MLSIKEAATQIGVHWQTIRNYIDRGELKAYKIGRLLKIKEEDLTNFIENKSEHTNDNVNLEIELRYKVNNREQIEKNILDLGGKITYHAHVIDHWFIPIKVKSRKQHDVWFDQKRGCGIRIREQDNGYTGKVVTSLETKRLTKAMNHNTFLEAEIQVENYNQTKTLLEMMDRKEFLTIDKDRVVYDIKDYKITIDDIKGYGIGLEIEITKAKDRIEAIKNIQAIARKLGLSEKDAEQKSATVSAMQKLANFD